MPIIIATDRAVYHAAVSPSGVLAAGITPPANATATGEANTLPGSADENDFLALVAGNAGAYNPLPDVGATLMSGDIYGHNGELVIVRQSHVRTPHDPADVPALFSVYRENQTDALAWIADERVYVGTQRTYDGLLYECIQAHTTQSDWTPDTTPSLWTVVTESDEWQVGVAYRIDDVVTYQDIEYICIQSHTSQAGWEPPNVPALWSVR